MSKQVIVIGGGAAGAMAAYMAAKNGHKVTLFEKNEKIGKKIFITGKGRCNVTNACDITDFFFNKTQIFRHTIIQIKISVINRFNFNLYFF